MSVRQQVLHGSRHGRYPRNSYSPHSPSMGPHTRGFPRGGGGNVGPLAYEHQGGNWETIRGHFVAASGEFVGTVMFLYFSFGGTQVAAMSSQNNAMDPQRLLYISLSFGISLAAVAWTFYRVSGGLFNPAVVLGMCISGSLPWTRGAFLVPAEILGAIVAAALNQCMFPGPIVTVTTLAAETSIAQGLFIELFLTFQLVITILMLAAEKHMATFIAPVGIGLSLFIAELTGVYFTGGSLNPARSFGPSVAARTFPGYHWIYWLGPALGALCAAGYYRFVKYFNYEEANPGQDDIRDK